MRRTYSYRGLRFEVATTGEADLTWLDEFLEPAFQVTDEAPDILVRLVVDADQYREIERSGPAGGKLNAFMLDTQIIRLPLWDANLPGVIVHEEKNALFYHVDGPRVSLVAGEWKPRLRIRLMRVLREYAMGAMQLSGGRFLHAAAISHAGWGAILAGSRGAGKTTLLTYLLLASDMDFVGNDRVLLNIDAGRADLHGMPTIISIRPGTFEFFPEMLDTLNTCRFNARSTLAECATESAPRPAIWSEGRRGLTGLQYNRLTDSTAVARTVPRLLLFPSQTGKPGGLELRQASPEEVIERFGDCLFGNIAPDSLSDLFTARAEIGGGSAALSDSELAEVLAHHVTGYECRLGLDAYADTAGASAIQELIKASEPAESMSSAVREVAADGP